MQNFQSASVKKSGTWGVENFYGTDKIVCFTRKKKKKANELFTLFKLILMLSLISYQQGEYILWKYITAVCGEEQISL